MNALSRCIPVCLKLYHWDVTTAERVQKTNSLMLKHNTFLHLSNLFFAFSEIIEDTESAYELSDLSNSKKSSTKYKKWQHDVSVFYMKMKLQHKLIPFTVENP